MFLPGEVMEVGNHLRLGYTGDFEKRTLSVNKQVVKRNFGADVRKVVEKKGKKEQRSSWYFTTPKTEASARTIPFGDTLYQALKQEKTEQMKNEMKYGEFYTIHVLKKEIDEKGNDMFRIVPVPGAFPNLSVWNKRT